MTAIKRTVLLAVILTISAATYCLAQARHPDEPKVGDLYSINSSDGGSDGRFCVIRVLATREHDFYIRIYGDRFASRPRDVDLSQLSLRPHRGDGMVLVSIVRRYFKNSKPRFIKNVGPPTGEDLTFSEQWARVAPPPRDHP